MCSLIKAKQFEHLELLYPATIIVLTNNKVTKPRSWTGWNALSLCWEMRDRHLTTWTNATENVKIKSAWLYESVLAQSIFETTLRIFSGGEHSPIHKKKLYTTRYRPTIFAIIQLGPPLDHLKGDTAILRWYVNCSIPPKQVLENNLNKVKKGDGSRALRI